MLFLVDNMGTVVVAMVVVSLVLFAILKLIKDKKKGNGCSGICSDCVNANYCNKDKEKK